MTKIIVILTLLLAIPLFAQSEEKMNLYQERILERRISEANQLWKVMEQEGFIETTIVALDFTFFSNDKNGAEDLVKSLSENYKAEIAPSGKEGYWLIKGTTRPYGNEFNNEQWLGWVDFMVSVGFSNNTVFSTWSVYDPKTKKTWSSENIEID